LLSAAAGVAIIANSNKSFFIISLHDEHTLCYDIVKLIFKSVVF